MSSETIRYFTVPCYLQVVIEGLSGMYDATVKRLTLRVQLLEDDRCQNPKRGHCVGQSQHRCSEWDLGNLEVEG